MSEMQMRHVRTPATAGRLISAGIILFICGVALTGIVYALTGHDLRRLAFSYLLNFTFALSLALGALLWVALHHLTRAGWSVTLRRTGEAVSCCVIPLGLAGIPVLLALPYLYPWSNPEIVARDAVLLGKAPYLNMTFFVFRYVFYFVVWSLLAHFFMGHSSKQDATGSASLTAKMESVSPVAVILLALTLTFFSFDFLMSLDPHWFSTIFGVYFFSGCLVAWFALLGVIACVFKASSALRGMINIEHIHDVGKLVFAFVVFWAYIAFSQYMLIWYGNLPEETGWIARRQNASWMGLTYFLLAGHFIIPFFGMLSRHIKRNALLLSVWCCWILAMHWLDLYWLVIPEYQHGSNTLGVSWTDFVLLLSFAGLLLAGSALALRKSSLFPTHDPRLSESLVFENM